MGSSRFPGKMMREIAGKPLIWHVIHRLRQARRVTRIILATSDRPEDDALAAYAAGLVDTVVRGPEQNVLRRFVMALAHTDADLILRITGDAPLIDPGLIDRLIDALERSGADFAVTSGPGSDCGIDPITRRALLRIATERADHPAAIEHVTGYLAVDPGFASRCVVPVERENRFIEGARFSIDTPTDLAFIEAIYRRLGAPAGEAQFLDVLRLLRAEPELLAMNRHVRQRGAGEKPPAVLIRCDGGHEVGLGHVVRCLAIASALRDHFGAAVTFLLGGDAAALDLVRAEAFPVIDAQSRARDVRGLAAGLAAAAPDVLLMDLRAGFDTSEIAAIRDAGCALAVLDDASDRRLHADLGFFFPPSATALDWRGARGEACIGFEWIPLRAQFSPPPARRRTEPKLALIVAGGSDPTGIGRRWLESAARVLPHSWQIAIAIGAAAAADARLDDLVRNSGGRVAVYRQVSDMAGLMARAELSLASFGMTAYELASIGVPMLLLCLSEDHCRSAAALAEKQAARVLGLAPAVADPELDRAVAELAADAAGRDAMSRNARALVDGLGARRIAKRIAALASRQVTRAGRA